MAGRYLFANLKSMVFFAFSSCSLQPSATLLKVQRRTLAKKNIEIAATNQILERADIPGTRKPPNTIFTLANLF
jgi:hypothetical protein